MVSYILNNTNILLGTDAKVRKVSQARLLNFVDSIADRTAIYITDALGVYKCMKYQGRWDLG